MTDENEMEELTGLFSEDDVLKHYGTPRHSGRYPWGSGENPYQRNADFLGRIDGYRKMGMSEVEIAKSMGMSSTRLRRLKAIALEENRAAMSAEAFRLREKGMSPTAIAKRMGLPNESSARSLLNPSIKVRMERAAANAKVLKEQVDRKQYLDITSGSETAVGLSQTKFLTSVEMLQKEGYQVHNVWFNQLGTGKRTTVKLLCPPGTTWADAMKHVTDAKPLDGLYSEDKGDTVRTITEPVKIDHKRVMIRYATGTGDENDGGARDGLIELRRGVDDISLKNARYAQVRIAMDEGHFLKGMAMYSPDESKMPPGVDIIFNTNKKESKGWDGVFNESKELDKNNPDNPFGASIKPDKDIIRAQHHYIGADGKEHQSALNIVNEEGDWSKWKKTLASQFLSKQAPALAKQQLDVTYKVDVDQFNDISRLTNPTLKRKMLLEFASQMDSDAVHMAAAALPRQATKVILPFPELKDTEIYAPHLEDGTKVALVRYPHAGIFEIPTLTVNNRVKSVKEALGTDIRDAVGINARTAEHLSGADFDGDSVLVIPMDRTNIRNKAPLKGLVGFDNKAAYPEYEGMKRMTKRQRGMEMGKITNLITDMTIQGASDEELERAVRHSMVVIDAYKHHLNYRQSEQDNNIAQLRLKYQGKASGGSQTLLSRATSPYYVKDRKEKLYSKMTAEEKERWKNGEMIYTDTNYTHTKRIKDKDGNTIGWERVPNQLQINKLEAYPDAYSLTSTGGKTNSTPRIEIIYAEHSNRLKALANQARALARQQKDLERNASAAETYSKEVAQLNAALNEAVKNRPLERQAQTIATKEYKNLLYSHPEWEEEKRKRAKGRALERARDQVGAHKKSIFLTDRQWEAINAGALSKTKLRAIFDEADKDRLRQLATPRTRTGMTSAKVMRARSLLNAGYTQAEVADMLDVSVSTLMNNVDSNVAAN